MQVGYPPLSRGIAMSRLLFFFIALPALAQAPVPAEVRLAQASFHEYLEFLSLPSDAVVPADIQKNTDWLEQAFRKRGFTTKQLDNKGKPMLFAEWPKKVPGAKTVLYYMHLDGQPVIEREWSQKSPWQPVVKKLNAHGARHLLRTYLLSATPLAPNLRVSARASSDHKGPIMMFLAAF